MKEKKVRKFLSDNLCVMWGLNTRKNMGVFDSRDVDIDGEFRIFSPYGRDFDFTLYSTVIDKKSKMSDKVREIERLIYALEDFLSAYQDAFFEAYSSVLDYEEKNNGVESKSKAKGKAKQAKSGAKAGTTKKSKQVEG